MRIEENRSLNYIKTEKQQEYYEITKNFDNLLKRYPSKLSVMHDPYFDKEYDFLSEMQDISDSMESADEMSPMPRRMAMI